MANLYETMLAQTEAKILLLNDVITKALAADVGTILSYSLDDGQTKETVTKRSVGPLQDLQNKLINDHETFSNKLGLTSNIAQMVHYG